MFSQGLVVLIKEGYGDDWRVYLCLDRVYEFEKERISLELDLYNFLFNINY